MSAREARAPLGAPARLLYPSAVSNGYALTRLASFASGAKTLAKGILGTAEGPVAGWWSSLLGEDFGGRIARVPMSLTSQGTDPFGLDPQWTKWALASAAFLHRKYFRSEVHGAAHIPSGRVLLVANHSGQVPIDGALIGAALF